MDFDKILPIIIFIIWFIVVISKQIGKKQKSPSPKKQKSPTSPFFKKLQSTIENIIEEYEKPKNNLSGVATSSKVKGTKTQSQNRSEKEKNTIHEEIKEEIHSSKPPILPKVPNYYKRGPHKQALQKGKKRTSTLQKAVIWSEILSKPISLREN